MNEIIIEGLVEKDFYLLEKILKDAKIGLAGEVTWNDLSSLYNKVKDIIDFFEANK